MKSLNRKIGTGVIWNMINLVVSRGATTIFTLLLARLLVPETFGLIAMVTVAFELSNAFVDSGLGQALIRSQSVTNADLNTVFYSNLFFSACAYVVLFLGAPYLSAFYDQPELTSIVQVMGLVVFINATRVVQMAVLTKAMNFRSQMQANGIAALGSGCLALIAANLGWGVWSLVIMMLSQSFITSLVMWLASHWRPTLSFSKESFIRLFGFGRNLLAEGMLDIAFQNSYVLVIGRLFSAEITGLYFFAKKVSDLISQQLTFAVVQVTYPALSTLQDNNKGLRQKYRNILQLTIFIIAPVMSLLAVLSSSLFDLFLKDNWQGAVAYLQLFCVIGALYPIHALNVNLMKVKGRSDLVLKVGVIKKILNISLLIAAIPFGVFGILISQIVGSLLALALNAFYATRLIDYSLLSQIKDVAKPVFAAAMAGVVCFWVIGRVDVITASWLVFTSVVSGITYIVVSLVMKVEGSLIILKTSLRYFKV